jgi:adenosylcobinamide-GDP ribazoletransferase
VNELRAIAAAFTFMTRFPLGPLASHDEADLRRSAAYFPLVGVAVGGLGAAAYAVGNAMWPVSVSVLMSMIATVLATGAFHEDALADTLDGFGGGRTAERVLEIMKDSRVGSYALVGVSLVLATKFAALSSIAASGTSQLARALVAAHVIGRWSCIPLMTRYSYVRSTTANPRPSAGGPFVEKLIFSRALIATVIAAVAVIVVLGPRGVLAAGIPATCALAAAGMWFRRRIGGITGDTLGAANQIVELSVYLGILAFR